MKRGGVQLAVAGPRLLQQVRHDQSDPDPSLFSSGRMLQQVHERRDKLRALSRSSRQPNLDFRTFQHGVQQVGLIMGDEDSRRLWAAAGGAVGRQVAHNSWCRRCVGFSVCMYHAALSVKMMRMGDCIHTNMIILLVFPCLLFPSGRDPRRDQSATIR